MAANAEDRVRQSESRREDRQRQRRGGGEDRPVTKATRLSASQVYEVTRREGTEEMTRPVTSLVFSGLAAGILIAFSILGEAVFRAHLPDTPWRPLVESLGYTLGFVLVIVGRMQLFTENTITTVLPIMDKPCREYFVLTVRLWGVVLGANTVGAFIAATFFAHGGVFGDNVLGAITEISRSAILHPPLEGFVKAIPAGILIAAIVWMLPSVPRNPIPVIVAFTWLMAAGGFTHIVAGSVEMAHLLVLGEIGLGPAIGFFVPVLLGNVVGGTVIFAAINYAQIVSEVEE